jgi:4-diphosphocytidyl-2-C-methyl-D-erythritol kinase
VSCLANGRPWPRDPDQPCCFGNWAGTAVRNADVAAAVTIVRSPAKVNWNLRVHARRSDGYHDIESLTSALTLEDELRFEDRPEAVFTLVCDHPQVPADDSNLVLKAARLLADRSGCCRGVACTLIKHVPVGGGLGGGSSNAAATLMALNRVWLLDWSKERLSELAAEIGSDVSFFIHGGSAVISGRGERVRPVKLGWRGWVVLIIPPFGMSTAAVYAAWQPSGFPPASREPDGRGTAVEWMAQTFNMLEEPAMKVRPVLGQMRDHLARLSNRTVRMSGSGSTLFTAFDTREEAATFADQARSRLDVQTCVVQPAESV